MANKSPISTPGTSPEAGKSAKPKKKLSPGSTKIQLHYIKSNHFRVINGEGIIGSLSPHGKIFFVFFNERGAIPRSMTHLLSKDGHLGETLETETRGGIVREMEFGVFMNLEDAILFRDWLDRKIEELSEAVKARKRNVHKSRKS